MLRIKARAANSASSSRHSLVTGYITVLLALLLTTPVLSGSLSQDKRPKQDPPQRDDEPVQLHSDLVVVNLVVTDSKGQYAHGLSAADFKVLEDEAPQPIDSFLAEEASFAAAILIDTSGSMDYKLSLIHI